MKKIGLFPGSFDPFTKGHEAVINKCLSLFDEVIIGVGVNTTKVYMFDLDKRINHIESLFKGDSRVNVHQYEGLTVNFCKDVGASYIIRGLRNSSDFEFEKAIAQMNFDMTNIDTVFFLTDAKYAAINSSIVREINKNDGDIALFVTNAHLLV